LKSRTTLLGVAALVSATLMGFAAWQRPAVAATLVAGQHLVKPFINVVITLLIEAEQYPTLIFSG